MNKVAFFAIIGTAMFLLSAGGAFAATPSGGTVHIQPNPTLNTNVTWSTFYHGWNPLEYSNGTGNQTLNAGLNSAYGNPLTINPADIQSSSFKETLGTSGIYWNKTYNTYGGNLGTLSPGAGKLTMVTTSSNTTVAQGKLYWNISSAYIPSLNPQYDYVTILYTSTQTGTGNAYIQTAVGNGSNQVALSAQGTQIKNETAIESKSNSQPTTGTTFESLQASDFVKNFNSGYMLIGTSQTLPETTTNGAITVNTTILGLMLTSNPVSLGTFTNATGQHPITGMETADGQDVASAFNPDFSWSSITNNGYSVAVSQPLQNLTTQQNAISSGNYIEQVEYQGQFDLPTAPDLSYGPANLTEQFNVSTAQTQVLDINGVSYLSTISGKNGTIQLLSSVNPNSKTQFLQIVDYTQSQWNSISVAPGIFTIAGIEYYWWIAVGGLATLIGLAGAAKHAGTKADQERIRRGR